MVGAIRQGIRKSIPVTDFVHYLLSSVDYVTDIEAIYVTAWGNYSDLRPCIVRYINEINTS